jgi:autotransporter-associated beta strand protein
MGSVPPRFFALFLAAGLGLALPHPLQAAPVFGITTSSTTTSQTTFVVSGTAALATGTSPMWFEVRTGSSTGQLIDSGAFATRAAWQFQVRHLQMGVNTVTVFAGVSGNLATASINLTFVLDDPNTPSVRPRPRGAEVWWGGVAYMDQTVLNPTSWQYTQRYEDGFFLGPGFWGTAGYPDSVAQQLTVLLTGSGALNAPAVRFLYESPCHQAQGMNAIVNGQISFVQRMENDGFVASEINTDFGADIGSYCQQQPAWASNDILAWDTGDATIATPGGPYLSATTYLNNTGWSGYLAGMYPVFPHTKIGQTWSPAGFSWKDPTGTMWPVYTWDVLGFDPLTNASSSTMYVNGQPVYFNWSQDQLWACDLDIAAAQPDSFHQYYAFTTDFPHLYTTGTDALGDVDFPAYAAAIIRQKIITYEAWLHSLGMRHTRICNADDALLLTNTAQQNIYYENCSMDIMQRHQIEGGRADRYLLEDWEPGVPNQVTPETTPGTFTHLAKGAIKYLKGINDDGSYESLQLSVAGSSGGEAVIQITNYGDVACLPAITVVESGSSGFTTQYFGADGTNCTAAALGAEGYVPNALLQSGDTTTLTIAATPALGTPSTATRTFTIEAFWNPQDPTGYVRSRAIVTLGAVEASIGNVKGNNSTPLNQTSSWTGGAVPGPSSVAQWDSTVTGASATSLGADISFGGINIVNPGGAVSINAGNTLTLYAAGVNLSAATQSLTFNNAVTLAAPQTWSVAAGQNIQVNGALTGGSNTELVKSGSGTVTLAGTVNFPGIISLTSGTFSITTSNASIGGLSGASGTLLQTGGSTLTIGGNDVATTFAGNITGPGGLILSGSSALTLTGSSNYTGGTTVSSGTLDLGDGFALSSGTVTDNATVAIDRNTPLTLDIRGFGSVVKSGTGTFTMAPGATDNYASLLVMGGTFAVTGGSLTLTSTSYTEDGGTFVISGGTVTNTACLMYVGSYGPGTLDVTGGTLNVGQMMVSDLGSGLGTVNVSGSGTISASILQLSNNGGATLNLNGGTTITNVISSQHGEASVWFNGGILRANTGPWYPWIYSNLATVGVENGGAILDSNGQNVTIAMPLLAAQNSVGGLTKQGLGKLTLSCSNTYVGATNVLAGTLVLGGTASIATSGTIDVHAGAALDVTAQNGGFSTSSAQPLIGSGTVAGSLAIQGTAGSDTATGILTFTSGTATFGPTSHLTWNLIANSNSTPGTNFSQVIATSLIFNAGAVVDISLSGTSSGVNFTNSFWTSTHTWTVVSCAATTGTPNIGSLTTDSGGRSASAYGWFSISNTAAGIVLTWNPGAPSATVSVTALTGSISQSAPPTAAYSVARTGTTGSLGVSYDMSGSAMPGIDYVATNSITIPSGQSSATVMLTPVNNNQVEAARTAILTLANGGNYLIGSPSSASVLITDSNQQFTFKNTSTTGTLNWSGSSNWTGSTPAVSGSLNTIDLFTGQTLASGTITVNNNVANPCLLDVLTLDGTGPAGVAGGVTLTGGTFELVPNSGYAPIVNLYAVNGAYGGLLTYNVTNPVILTATTNIQGYGNATFNFSGTISGSGGILKSDTSILTLSGSNSFTGAITLNQGTINITGSKSLPAVSGITVATGAQLEISNPANGISYTSGTMILGGTGNSTGIGRNGGALYLNSYTLGFTSPIVLLPDSPPAAPATEFTSYSINAVTTFGSISGSGSLLLQSAGAATTHLGTWIFTGSSTYAGSTQIYCQAANGIIKLSGGNNRLPVGTVLNLNADYNYGSGIWSYVNFDLGGCNQTLGGLIATGTGVSTVINTGSAPVTLTISGTANTAYDGIIGGTGTTAGINLVKAGIGQWTLTGSAISPYTGSTIVSSGTLALSAGIPNTISINIQGGAKLDVTAIPTGLTLGTNQLLTGAGTVSGAVTITGTHQPGNGIGTGYFTGSLAYGPASHLAWALIANAVAGPGANYDQVSAGTVTGSTGAVVDLILNGAGSTVDFTNTFWTNTQSWAVISATSVSGTFATGSVTPDHNGVTSTRYGSFSVQLTSNAVNLIWSPTPYNHWLGTYFGANTTNPALVADTANPAGDGIPNLMKYALGLNPSIPSVTGLPTPSTATGYLLFTFTKVKSATDILYQPLWSNDLHNWSSTGITESILSDNGTTQQIQVQVPDSTDKSKFIKLQITRP